MSLVQKKKWNSHRRGYNTLSEIEAHQVVGSLDINVVATETAAVTSLEKCKQVPIKNLVTSGGLPNSFASET